MSTTATRAPSAANRRHVAAPIPDPPPVTNAAFASSNPMPMNPSIEATTTIMVQRRWEHGMWKATVKGIVAHRVRLVLSMVAVLLGVAFVAGTYVLTDTLQHSYDGLFTQTVANVDVVVRLRGEDGPELTRERFSELELQNVESVPEVEHAY